MKWISRFSLMLVLFVMVMAVCLGNVFQRTIREANAPPGAAVASWTNAPPVQASMFDPNFFVLMFLGAWIHSKVARLTEYSTVVDAAKAMHAKVKDRRLHWIPGDVRKRFEDWVDRMASRSSTIEELQANMETSLENGLEDVEAAVHPAPQLG
jgi:hypothetical protein